jgi:hypothetical protein
MAERSVETAGFRLDHLLLDPIAFVVEEAPEDERDPVWVRGIVASNPFGEERPEGENWPAGLSETSLVVCSVGQWHPWSDIPEGYELRSVEWSHTTDLRSCAWWVTGEANSSSLMEQCGLAGKTRS